MSEGLDILLTASEAQRRATTPGSSAWVEANAGTGKTKVLTDRVTRLLLDGVRPERILCLTFTKAAAAEMHNRLAGQLGRWAMADDAELGKEITALIDEVPQAAQRSLARRLFARVLDAPGGINILTIHAFCQSLLKRFPLEAGVTPVSRCSTRPRRRPCCAARRTSRSRRWRVSMRRRKCARRWTRSPAASRSPSTPS